MFIRADPANARATYAALAAFGAAVDSIHMEDLSNPRKFIRFGREPIAVDILSNIDEVTFDDAWERRVESVIDRGSGLTAFFISRTDLIASKLATGRTRDLADVEEIRETEVSRSEQHRSE